MIITHAKNIPRALQLLVSVVILFSAAFPLASCSSEDLQPDVDNNQTSADDSTVSSLSLLFVCPGTTRAVSEGTISSVYVILSDKAKSQGNIAYKTALQPTNGKVTLKVRPSNYNVYVWANVPAKNFQSVSTLGDLDRVMYGSLSSYSELPMLGKGTATVPPDKTVTTSMVLNHLTAKLAFNIVSEYPASTVVSAKLYHNTVEIPLSGHLSTTTNIVTTTDSADLTKPIYVWGNSLIGKGTATDWVKRDSTDTPKNASYLEIKVQLFGEDIPTMRTYRVYLGGLTPDGKSTDFADYNIYPGVAYTYDITLKRNGIAVWGHVPDPGYAESKAFTFEY